MRDKTDYALVFLCIAAIGCFATIAQVILIREFLNIFYGNELCLGIVFGAWFLGIATGAFAGAKIEHAFKHAFTVFVITLMVMCFVLPVQIVSVRGVRGLLNVGIGEYISILPLLLTSIGLILPFSFIIGFAFPFSSKVISGSTRNDAVDVGTVYIIESMGSLFGGLVFSFFLVSRFHPFKIIALLNVGMFVLLTLLLFNFHRKGHVYSSREEDKKTKRVLGFISLGMALVIMVVLFSPIPDGAEALSAKMRWKTLNPHIELVASADSKYQHIDVGRQAGQYSVYLNGNYASAFPNEYEYAQIAHLAMTQHPSPKRVLLIGIGLGGLLSEMLLYPIEALDYVELDQRLLQITGTYLSPLDSRALSDKRVTVFHQDGRYFVKRTSMKHCYDVVLINMPDPSTAFLNRFYTYEFFQEIRDVLKNGGVLATSASSAVTYIGKEVGSYTGSIYRTLHETFRHVLVTPGQTNFYFACDTDGAITLDVAALTGRYQKSLVKSDYFTEHLFYTLLQPEQVAFIEKRLSQRKDLLVNTDARPVTYFLNLVLWDALTGGHLHGVFGVLQGVGLKSFLIPIFIALAGRIIYVVLMRRIANRPLPCKNGGMEDAVEPGTTSPDTPQSGAAKRFNLYYARQLKANCLIAIAVVGFTSIALEIAMLYAFQNIYGYIYERMGVIVALFMVGLALGGYIANKIIRKIDDVRPVQNGGAPLPDKIRPSATFPCRAKRSLRPTTMRLNILMILVGAIGCYALAVPFLIHAVSRYSNITGAGLSCFIGIAGVLTGLGFPIVSKIFMQGVGSAAASAGMTYGADHVGAILGAVLTGVILVPILGITGTCIILFALNISSLILLAFQSLKFRKRFLTRSHAPRRVLLVLLVPTLSDCAK